MDIGFQSMATENKVVIELQGSLPDTSDDTSPSELSWRKKVVDFFCRHKLVFIAVICGIIVGVPFVLRVCKLTHQQEAEDNGNTTICKLTHQQEAEDNGNTTVCNLTHQQEAEDNGNTTICNRTNEEGSSNAFSNQMNQQNAQDKIIDETPSPNTSYSSLEKCYYETPEDFLMKMLNNTFANEDYCTIGSQLVKTICWTGKEKSGSSHACEKCTDGSILPSICFCDEKVNCVNDAKLFGSRAADHSKKTCSWCKTIFNKQFKDQGIANCSSHNQPLVNITCKDGYGGSMCNVITALLCKFENGQSILKECNTSKLEECTMKSTLSGNYYHCEPFTDANIGETKGKKVCYLDAVP